MAINQHSNQCYSKIYVNDTSVPDGLITPEIVRGDSISVKDLGVKQTDVFGNEYYDLISKYKRSGLLNGQKDSSGNIIVDDKGGYVGNDNYQRTSVKQTYSPRADYPGFDYICEPCSTNGEISTPPGVPPAACSVFLQQAGAWQRKTMDVVNGKGVIVLPGNSVTNSQGIVINGPAPHDAKKYGEYNDQGVWITGDYINIDCEPRNPFTVLVPVEAGGLEFTYMNGEFILTIEGDKVVSAPNTTILVEDSGNV